MDTVEVKLCTGRTAVIRDLNGLENAQFGEMLTEKQMKMASLYITAYALVSIDGEALPAAMNSVDVMDRLSKLKGRELQELIAENTKAFGLPSKEDELEKS
jgi:hypothetical protein